MCMCVLCVCAPSLCTRTHCTHRNTHTHSHTHTLSLRTHSPSLNCFFCSSIHTLFGMLRSGMSYAKPGLLQRHRDQPIKSEPPLSYSGLWIAGVYLSGVRCCVCMVVSGVHVFTWCMLVSGVHVCVSVCLFVCVLVFGVWLCVCVACVWCVVCVWCDCVCLW